MVTVPGPNRWKSGSIRAGWDSAGHKGDLGAGPLDRESVVQAHRVHYGLKLVETVGPLAKHLKKEIELCRSHDLNGFGSRSLDDHLDALRLGRDGLVLLVYENHLWFV